MAREPGRGDGDMRPVVGIRGLLSVCCDMPGVAGRGMVAGVVGERGSETGALDGVRCIEGRVSELTLRDLEGHGSVAVASEVLLCVVRADSSSQSCDACRACQQRR